MLLLGAIQAQVSAPVAAGSFDLLATEILTSSQASVTFSSLNTLAAGYQHLQIRWTVRSTRADTDSYLYIQFNGDTGSNYSSHYLYGDGGSVGSGNTTTSYPAGMCLIAGAAGATQAANGFGAGITDILDPFETNKYTTTRTLSGQALAFDIVSLQSGSWRNTAALTSITIDDIFGSLAQYSRFSLYGWKAA